MSEVIKVNQLLGNEFPLPSRPSKRWIDDRQRVGIELEWEDTPILTKGVPTATTAARIVYEDKSTDLKTLRNWGVKIDGSLRGNYPYEILTLGPKGGTQLDVTMNDYLNWFKEYEPNPCLSEQTSTHVHIDVRSWTLEALQNFILLFAYMEDYLFDKWGPDRKNNVFCVPLFDLASSLSPYVGTVRLKKKRESNRVSLRDNFITFVSSCHKYGSLNLRPIRKLGSIEIRLAGGMCQPDHINDYLQDIFKLTKFAKENDTLTQEKFIKKILSSFKHLGTTRCTLTMLRLMVGFGIDINNRYAGNLKKAKDWAIPTPPSISFNNYWVSDTNSSGSGELS